MGIGSIRQISLASALQRGFEQVAGPRWRKHLPERTIKIVLLLCSSISIFTTVGIVSVLVFEAALFFQEVSIVEFLTSTEWTPLFASQNFGVWPLVTGTMLTSIGAMFVALPLGLLSAIYLERVRPGLGGLG
jgi:phosphate transport system permease protein